MVFHYIREAVLAGDQYMVINVPDIKKKLNLLEGGKI